jgi:short-subunit dehydrogenase
MEDRMNIRDARVLLTGAAGGIGTATALALARAGAQLAVAGRTEVALQKLCEEIRAHDGRVQPVVADLASFAGRQALAEEATRRLGGVDLLVNLAGQLDFVPFETEDPVAIERLMQVNLIAPIQLTRLLLPAMLKQGRGRIVNVGSAFGSIAFPYFAVYSSSKFGLRGFSQALRRELDGSGVGVTYIAPRATRTPLNSSAVVRMNEALKVDMDPPEQVAAAIVRAIEQERAEVYLGWPEKLFVRLNAILPGLVDGALRKQHAIMRKFAHGA